jgi:hypothetical protein
MLKFLGKLYATIQGTYRGVIMLLVIAVVAGAGYGGYVVYDKVSSMFRVVKNSYGRGAGIPMVCGSDEEQNGALCYPKCKAGYVGAGPVCWQACPAGFRDDGAFCGKPEAYGRGAGYVIWDEGKCRREHGDCEKNGAMWYPKCRANFHNVGCCVCSPDCPSDMTDIGVSCSKKSYGRTAGTPLHACPEGHEKDGALCYPLCKPKYKGVGPLCWET